MVVREDGSERREGGPDATKRPDSAISARAPTAYPSSMSRAATGESRSHDSEAAGRHAAREAIERLGCAPDAMLVFATAGHEQGPLLASIRREAPDAVLVGCTGAGVITRRGSDEGTHAVAVLAIASEHARFEALFEEGFSHDAEALGARLGAQVAAHDRPRALFAFPDGLTGNASAFLRGLERTAPSELLVFGGAAGELMQLTRTYQYAGPRVASDSVAALLIEGDLRFETEVSHGCRPLGLEHVVTRATGGTVYELDGRPAWEVLREYVDEPRETFSSYDVPYLALAQRLRDTDADVIRVPLGCDSATGALFFPGELPEGETLVMARRDEDDVIARAVDASRSLAKHGHPVFVLQADCTGRGRLLFGDSVTERAITPVQESFANDVAWLGFHSYGELAPLGGRARFHNYTMALCAAYDV